MGICYQDLVPELPAVLIPYSSLTLLILQVKKIRLISTVIVLPKNGHRARKVNKRSGQRALLSQIPARMVGGGICIRPQLVLESLHWAKNPMETMILE
jgi:hypothetical protein